MYGEVGKSFDALPAGDYTLILKDVSVDLEGKPPKNIPNINIEFSVADGEHKTRKVWKRYYFNDKTAESFLPWQIGILGIKKQLDEMDLSDYKTTAKAAMDLVGKNCIADGYEARVEVTDNGYNDLVLIGSAIIDEPVITDATAPPSMDEDEEMPF